MIEETEATETPTVIVNVETPAELDERVTDTEEIESDETDTEESESPEWVGRIVDAVNALSTLMQNMQVLAVETRENQQMVLQTQQQILQSQQESITRMTEAALLTRPVSNPQPQPEATEPLPENASGVDPLEVRTEVPVARRKARTL